MSKMGQQDCAFQTSERFVNNKTEQKSNHDIVFLDQHILILGNEYHIQLKDTTGLFTTESRQNAMLLWCGDGRMQSIISQFPLNTFKRKALQSPLLDCMTVYWCVYQYTC